jgi:hypothetical protein
MTLCLINSAQGTDFFLPFKGFVSVDADSILKLEAEYASEMSHYACLFGLVFRPEDGGSAFLQMSP